MSISNQNFLEYQPDKARFDAERKRVNKDTRSRLAGFASWMDENNRQWDERDVLLDYEQYLLRERGLRKSSTRVHLASIRGRYREWLEDPILMQEYFSVHPQSTARHYINQYAEMIETVLDTGTHAKTRRSYSPRRRFITLTGQEPNDLLRRPGTKTLRGLRDTSIIALLLCTGVRLAELCALQVSDLDHHIQGDPALHVPDGDECTERLIPYGEIGWVRIILKAWLEQARIEDGFVFRGIVYQTDRLRDDALTPRAVQNVLAKYYVTALDLRRTYATHLFVAGVDPADIQEYLGLSTREAVMNYIGAIQPHQPVPPQLYQLDVTSLLEDLNTT